MAVAAEHPSKADLREALLDQLAHLIDEVEAVKPVVDQVPEELQQLPTTETKLSLRQTYGLLAAYDREVLLPRLERMVAEDDPHFESLDVEALAAEADWNERPIDVLLDRVQEARRTLLTFLERLPPAVWDRTATVGEATYDVYGLAHHITQRDVDLLREIGYHLYTLMPDRAPTKA
jgi:hypothetical protein